MKDAFYSTLIAIMNHLPQGVLQTSSGLLHFASHIPENWFTIISGGTDIKEGRTLHPQFQILIQFLQLLPRFDNGSIQNARQLMTILSSIITKDSYKMRFVKNLTITGHDQEIPIRAYIPKNIIKPAPVLIYYHGGGWTFGDLDTHDGVCRMIAHEGRCVVVAVDYRLAPENKYPAAIEDAYAVYLWARWHAAQIDGNPLQIAVGGDNAGATLATQVCYQAKQENLSLPCFQMLLYPITDLRLSTRSYEVFREGLPVTQSMMQWFVQNYLSDASDAATPEISPLLIKDLQGLPPALVTTAGFDPVHDEGALYAQRLKAADVPVTYKSYDSFPHAYIHFTDVIPAVRAALLESISDLRSAIF